MPISKPFLTCTAYGSPNATSDMIDKLAAEMSVAQASGLELIQMGDINIDYRSFSNTKLTSSAVTRIGVSSGRRKSLIWIFFYFKNAVARFKARK